MSELADLEKQLRIAQEKVNALLRASSDETWDELNAAHEKLLRLERLVAAARGEEYAEPCDFPLKWSVGAPLPHLMVNDNQALLAFLLSEPDPNWDGSYATIVDPSAPQPLPLGLVTFHGCASAKLGDPNDEVFEGHPLDGRGMEAYAAQRVINSRWIREIEAINSVHRGYRAEVWQSLSHFIFWFHDTTFECIAESYTVETHRISMKQMLALMAERLLA